MENEIGGSRFVLITICLLFTVTSILLAGMLIWMISGISFENGEKEIMTLLTSTSILTIATGLIAGFMWYIIFKKNWVPTHE